jgi:hypothetical protein
MKECTICKQELTDKALDIDKMLNKEEALRLKIARKASGICSECSITMLMLNLCN